MALPYRYAQKVRAYYAPRHVRSPLPTPNTNLPPHVILTIITPMLALLAIPTVTVATWSVEYGYHVTTAFGWGAFGDLALPLGACICAAIVFLVRNPMHALLSLLGVFFSTVLMYLAAGISFVGLVFLIVYVGAVAVLFLFVIMLLNVKSLTPTDDLIQHSSQTIAIMFTGLLLVQVQRCIVASLDRALADGFLRDTMIEPTTGEAVLFYIRYQAMDINALTGLYTLHAVLFMVITSILLAALLGAIILATVTTERATAVSDIRQYLSKTSSAAVAAAPAFFLVTPATTDFIAALPDFLVGPAGLTVPWTLAWVSWVRLRDNEDLYLHHRRDSSIRQEQNVVTDSLPLQLPVRRRVACLRLRATARGSAGVQLITKMLHARSLRGRRVRKLCPRPKVLRVYAPGILSPTSLPITRRGRVVSSVVRQKWSWHWRRNRAAWLTRVGQEEDACWATADSPESVFRKRPTMVTRYWGDLPTQQIFWARSPRRSWWAPLSKLRLMLTVRILSRVHFYAWRIRAFCVLFFYFLFIIPPVSTAAYVFAEDYWVIWEKLHEVRYEVAKRLLEYFGWNSSFAVYLLLIPAAAAVFTFHNALYIVGLSALFAYETVGMHAGLLSQVEFHESRCNYWRKQANQRHMALAIVVAARLKRESKRHPDTGEDAPAESYNIQWIYWMLLPPWAAHLVDQILIPIYNVYVDIVCYVTGNQVYRCLSAVVRRMIPKEPLFVRYPFLREWRDALVEAAVTGWSSGWSYWRLEIWSPALEAFYSHAWLPPHRPIYIIAEIDRPGFSTFVTAIFLVAMLYSIASLILWAGWRRMYYGLPVRRPRGLFVLFALLFSIYWGLALHPHTWSVITAFPHFPKHLDPTYVYNMKPGSWEAEYSVSTLFKFYGVAIGMPCVYALIFQISRKLLDNEILSQAFTLRAYINFWAVRTVTFDPSNRAVLSRDLSGFSSNVEANAQLAVEARENARAVHNERRDKVKHDNIVQWTYVPKYYDYHIQERMGAYRPHSAFHTANHYKNPFHSA